LVSEAPLIVATLLSILKTWPVLREKLLKLREVGMADDLWF
jgi:hypothetical protein